MVARGDEHNLRESADHKAQIEKSLLPLCLAKSHPIFRADVL